MNLDTDTRRDLLLDARNLLSRGWTRHTNARKSDGTPTYSGSSEATCWCINGALLRATSGFGYLDSVYVHHHLYLDLRAHTGDQSLSQFNDAPDRTHAEIIELFDRALAALPPPPIAASPPPHPRHRPDDEPPEPDGELVPA